MVCIMKRNIFFIKFSISLFLLILVCAFSSCENDSVDIIRSDVEFSIRVSEVVSPFQAYSAIDKEMYSQDGVSSKILLDCLLYDDSGNLIKEFTKMMLYYTSELITFSAPVTGSNPTLVCISYAIWTDPKDYRLYKAYDISGKESLSTLRIEEDQASQVTRIPWQVLGGTIVKVGATTQKVSASLKPLGGLAYLSWEDIHSHAKESTPPTRYVMMYKYNDVAMVNNNKEFTYSTSLATTYYFYSEIFPSKNKEYKNIYNIQFMMPSDVDTFGFGGYYLNGNTDKEKVVGRTDNKSIKIDAEKQYVFIMDCNSYTMEVKQGILN